MKQAVLIAESDTELSEAYQRFLVRHGYAVETAAHGLDCLEKLRRTTPAAVVLDLELLWGGSDGVLAWLRDEGPQVPVILTATAGNTANDIEPPAAAFLPKPFALKALLESVRTAVAQHANRSSSRRVRDAACSELYIG
jgi:two-component system phosphate regulon response regulator PhoB